MTRLDKEIQSLFDGFTIELLELAEHYPPLLKMDDETGAKFDAEELRLKNLYIALAVKVAKEYSLGMEEDLLRDLSDVGEIHHSVFDYRMEAIEESKEILNKKD